MLDLYRFLCVYLGMEKGEKIIICQKCKKIKAVVKYKGGNYCTWYCAKK
jgi:hypothetical protein